MVIKHAIFDWLCLNKAHAAFSSVWHEWTEKSVDSKVNIEFILNCMENQYFRFDSSQLLDRSTGMLTAKKFI